MVILAAILCPFLSFAGEATITWQSNTEPDLEGYRVYSGTAPGAYGPFVPVGNKTSHTITGLDEGQTYYFVVTAVDQAGNESGYSSPPASKTISSLSPPPAPVLNAPSSGSTQAVTSITFSWDASPGATKYALIIWSESGQMFFNQWAGNVTSYDVAGFPNDGTRYYWTVYPWNTAGFGPHSEIKNFSNGSVSPPPAPVLSAPSSGSTQSDTSITFTWNASSGATNYALIIWSATGQTFFNGWVGNVTSHTAPSFPNDGTRYYWTVYPWNTAGFGPHSEIRNFLNGSVTVSPPPAPVLTAPSSGATQSGAAVTFSWNASSGATNYALIIWSESGQMFFNQWAGNVTSYDATGFPNDGTRYYWTVYPGNASGLGSHSEIRNFINGE